MDEEIKKKFINSMFKFRKTAVGFSGAVGIKMSELVIMKAIMEGMEGSEDDFFKRAQNYISVSKAAISQGIGTLERNGYICRSTSLSDRRKMVLKLTEDGKALLKRFEEKADEILSRIIDGFTAEKTIELIGLIDEFSCIHESVTQEMGKI